MAKEANVSVIKFLELELDQATCSTFSLFPVALWLTEEFLEATKLCNPFSVTE